MRFARFSTCLVAALVGLASYYLWPSEPSWAAVHIAVLIAGLAIIARVIRRLHAAFVLIIGLIAILLAGHGYAQFRTVATAQTVTFNTRDPVEVTGQLLWIERNSTGRTRLLVRPDRGTLCGTTDCTLRILASAGTLEPGDRVRLQARLRPPSRPVVPGGYDFAFHAFHSRLIATGFALSTVERLDPVDQLEVSIWLSRMRWRLSRHIQSRFSNAQGGLGSALLTGDRSGLSPDDAEALRSAGLGHILAISGLHMGLFAGGSFYAFRLLLAVALASKGRWDPAPAAAGLALLAGTFYLLLSGGSVPTQRAYIMACVSLRAVCLGRRAISMHTLMIAMVIVLLIRPHSLMAVGFQMSFAAVGALIAVYEAWRARDYTRAPIERQGGVARRVLQGLAGLSMTSLVAGSATAGFAAMHFHRIASFGMLANLVAMPVFTFVVMPAGALGLLLIPFSLDALPFQVMQGGLDLVMWIGHTVSDLPEARQNVPAPSGLIMALYICGFAAVVLLRGRLRLIGVGLALLALLVWSFSSRPALFISETGVVVAKFDKPDPQTGPREIAWQASSRRRDRFDVRVFLERSGVTDRVSRADLACDAVGCGGVVDGLRVVVLTELTDLDADCLQADLIVTSRSVPSWQAQQCAELLVDARRLQDYGAHQVWITAGQVARVQTVTAPERRRIWMR